MSLNWDQHYLDQETPWEKGVPAPPLLEWLEANPRRIKGRVLVPGCGLGHEVRAIAALDEIEAVIGLDLSPRAVELAARFPSPGAASYESGDLFALDQRHHAAYDWVWEHTCFCAIDPEMRESYVNAVFQALSPGGSLLGAFYMDPYDGDHQPGGGPPHGSTIEELTDLFSGAGKFEIVENYVPTLSYPGREGLEMVLRMIRN